MRTTRGTTGSTLTATLPSCRGAGARVPQFFANFCPTSWPRHPISTCYPKIKNKTKRQLVVAEAETGRNVTFCRSGTGTVINGITKVLTDTV
jgi:hypothetical protein